MLKKLAANEVQDVTRQLVAYMRRLGQALKEV
jgi:hypothetical protein